MTMICDFILQCIEFGNKYKRQTDRQTHRQTDNQKLTNISNYCLMHIKGVSKSVKASSYSSILQSFKDSLKGIFDWAGKNALDKKENLTAKAYIEDMQVYSN